MKSKKSISKCKQCAKLGETCDVCLLRKYSSTFYAGTPGRHRTPKILLDDNLTSEENYASIEELITESEEEYDV